MSNNINGNEKYPVHVQPTRDNLAKLAELDLKPTLPISIELTPEQFEMLPDHCDMRRCLAVVYEKMGVEHTYNSDDMTYDLEKLLHSYNDETPPQKFQDTVDPKDLSLDENLKLLRVIAACCDEEDRVRPWDAGTSVTEAMADDELEPATIFRNPKVPQPAS